MTFPYPQRMSMICQLILWCPCVLATPILTPPLWQYIRKYFSLMDIYSLCLQFLMLRILFHLFVFSVQNTNTCLKIRGSSSQNKHHKDHQFVCAKLHSTFSMCKIGTFTRERLWVMSHVYNSKTLSLSVQTSGISDHSEL